MSPSLARPASACLLALGLVLLAGCPDPSATSGGPTAGPMAQGAGGQPGQPGQLTAVGAPAPQGANAGVDWDDIDGDSVTLSGTLSYDGSKTGKLRLDFLGAGSLGGLQHTMNIDAAGPWSVRAPAKLGSVYIVAFVDVAGDGPSADDPAARTPDPVEIGAEDLASLDLTLVDDADLGDLTPGGPHPGDMPATPPTEGGDPPPTADGSVPPPPADGGVPPLPADGSVPPPPADGSVPPAPADGSVPPPTEAAGAEG